MKVFLSHFRVTILFAFAIVVGTICQFRPASQPISDTTTMLRMESELKDIEAELPDVTSGPTTDWTDDRLEI